jgi:Tol biopolymer transport system component
MSYATNLVSTDTGGNRNVFVRDRQAGKTLLVSAGVQEQPANGESFSPDLSPDGRYVAFHSSASNLVSGDGNGTNDVFVRDLVAGSTERVSVGAGGEGNAESWSAAISADGRYVAFTSSATNLVGGDANGDFDVFVRDRKLGKTERVSTGLDGKAANGASLLPAISADGRYVAFVSSATNLVPSGGNGRDQVYVHDRQTGKNELLTVSPKGHPGNGGIGGVWISGDGRYVVYSAQAGNLVKKDTNGKDDVFVHDRKLGTTERVSVGAGGAQANGASSIGLGRAITQNGRYVTFESRATNLVAQPSTFFFDVYVRDRVRGVTIRADGAPTSGEARPMAQEPSLSGQGDLVVFESDARDLVPGDTNGWTDIFVRSTR